MGLLGAKRVNLAGWQPDGRELATTAAFVDDDGCAGPTAYGARFTLASAAGASLTVWCYPVYAPPDMEGLYVVGMCCVYQAGDGYTSQESRRYAEDPEFIGSLAEAGDAAREAAQILARTRREGPSDDDLGFFDWDGAPW